MAEVTICARPDNVNHVSSTSQKRPLSIIAEQDCDDHDISKYQQKVDAGCKGKSPASKDVVESNKHNKKGLGQPKSSESKRSHKTKKGYKKSSISNSPKLQTRTTTKHPASISKSESNNTSPTLTSSSPVSKNENSKVPSDNKNQLSGDTTSIRQSEIIKLNSTNTLSQYSKQNSSDSCPDQVIPTVRTISSEESQATDVVSLKSCQGRQDKVVVQEETDQNTSLSPSSSSPLSFSPKANLRLSATAEDSSGHDRKEQTELHVPQITVTSNEGTCLDSLHLPCIDDIGNTTIRFPIDIISSKFTKDVSNNCSNNSLTNCVNYMRPKVGGYVSYRTKSIESQGSLLGSDLNESINGGLNNQNDTSSMTSLTDFWKLKETTEKLHLSTRRPSTMLWRQQYLEGQGMPGIRSGLGMDVSDERLTVERKQRIDDALEWLRNELQEMRGQDQNLARQLLTIRQEIHQLKLKRSTEEHQELIEDFQSELDDIEEFSDVLDFPQPIYGNNPLKHIGVTRLNISARRFSAC